MKNTWLFPVVQSLHVIGLGVFVGLIVANAIFRKALLAGLGLLLATGLALFLADAARYLSNPAFLIKLALSIAGLIFEFLIHPKWRTRPATAVSVALWSAVVIASRLVEDFDK